MRALGIAAAVILTAIVSYLQSSQDVLAKDDCSTANADICINVGETATLKVTNQLLQTYCVDNQGKPVDGFVTPEVSGEPDTGGARATFAPDPFRAYSESSLLSIRTTTETKPGNYAVDVNGTGTYCGRYHGFRFYLLVRPTITGPNALWSFNGAKPPNYRTEIKLTATPANMPPYNWFVPATSPLRFPNNGTTYQTITNTVKLHSLRATRSNEHPAIFISVKGGLSLDKENGYAARQLSS